MTTGLYILLFEVANVITCSGVKTFVGDKAYFENFTEAIFRNKRNKEFNKALKEYSPILKEVGLFIAGHKYLGKDARFRGREFLADRSYFRHFPIPRLKALDMRVSGACEKGAFSCLQEVYQKAKEFNRPTKATTRKVWPFYNRLDLFKYRTTASYFLCMFTLEKNVMMRKIYSPGQCLAGFTDTKESKETGVTVTDWRDDVIPFQCSRIYYCPDPCYGRKTNGNVESLAAQEKDPGNPCGALKYNHCRWAPGENDKFDGLMRNRFNISCACNLERWGFKWSSRFKMCVDRDECYERKLTCATGKVCQNTKGGAICVCRRGKKLNTATGKCEDLVLLPQLGNATSRIRPKKKTPSIIRRLEILFGVSSAADRLYSATWKNMVALFVVWQIVT